jgi:hypothetical protein
MNRARAAPPGVASSPLLLDAAHDQEDDGRQILELQYLYQPLDKLDTGEMRKMARDLGQTFNPEEDENILRLLSLMQLEEEFKDRLKAALQAGISHQVLNARKHTEESQIIAQAARSGDHRLYGGQCGYQAGQIANAGGCQPSAHPGRNPDPYDMSMEGATRRCGDGPAGYGPRAAGATYLDQRDMGAYHLGCTSSVRAA